MSAGAALVPPVLATLFALRKGSLSLGGIAASWLVGPVTGWASHVMSSHLYGFFFLSSLATRIGERTKRVIEGTAFKKGGKRTAAQVLAELVVEDVLHTTPRPRTRVAMADAESGGDDARWARVAMAWMDPCRAGCCVASEV